MEQQGPSGLAVDKDRVARLDVLEPAGQGAIGHLDRQEFQLLIIGSADHAIGAQQRTTVHFQAHHSELAAVEAESGVAGGLQGEQVFGPVMDFENRLSQDVGHFVLSGCHRVEQPTYMYNGGAPHNKNYRDRLTQALGE